MEKIKWWTTTEYVDLETGEIINKSEFERNYYKIRVNKKVKIEEYNNNGEIKRRGIVQYTTECRRKEQLKLFGE